MLCAVCAALPAARWERTRNGTAGDKAVTRISYGACQQMAERGKVEKNPRQPAFIRTVREVDYRFEGVEDGAAS